jgi:hypothetical protein
VLIRHSSTTCCCSNSILQDAAAGVNSSALQNQVGCRGHAHFSTVKTFWWRCGIDVLVCDLQWQPHDTSCSHTCKRTNSYGSRMPKDRGRCIAAAPSSNAGPEDACPSLLVHVLQALPCNCCLAATVSAAAPCPQMRLMTLLWLSPRMPYTSCTRTAASALVCCQVGD